MPELDELTRRALLARESPSASTRADMLTGLRDRLAGPAGPDDVGGGESIGASASGQAAWAAKIIGATIGLAAAGIVGLQVGVGVIRSVRAEPVSSALASRSVAEPTRDEPPTPEPEPRSDEPAVATASPIATSEAANRTVQAPSSDAKPLVGDPSTLAAELELIRAAKRLLETDPEAAIAKLDRHADVFPNGVLAPERETLRCDLASLGVAPNSSARRTQTKCESIRTDHGRSGDGLK